MTMTVTTKRTTRKTAAAGPAEPIALGGDVGNGGNNTITLDVPYVVEVTIEGVCPILFHRWQSDEVEAKARTPKGSAGRKTDNIEAYVWRDEKKIICLPGEYLRGTMINPKNGAAKYRQDPRSSRKSALDLYQAAVQSLTELAPIKRVDGKLAREWDYVDRRRAVVQRAGITRERPAVNTGWTATVQLMCQSPQYINPQDLLACLNDAGRLVGVGDFRPTFGRFVITSYKVL